MTTEQKQLAAIIAAAIFLALLTCTWFWGYDRGRRSVKCPVIEKTDTVYRTDTHFVEKPVEVIKWKEKEKTVYVAVRDTIVRNDTAYVVLPREHKVYEDSTYKAEISGVEPRLDRIEVYARTQTITSTIVKEAPRWSLGVTAGPGLLYDGNLHAGVGIVAGVQFRF